MSNAEKPAPQPNLWSKPFWDGCKLDHLLAPRCRKTGKVWFPPSPISPYTRTSEWDWTPLSGRGQIQSYVIMHQAYFDGFANELPYPIVQVLLDEGAMMLSNLVGISNDHIKIGMPVRVTFEQGPEGWKVPKFRPAAAA